jgi:hypothetical protein
MLTGGPRCKCKYACALVNKNDRKSTPKIAENFRERILRQIELLKPSEPATSDPAWGAIQADVAEMLDAALCRKHNAQIDMAVGQTMFLLKLSCGLSREAQNKPSHVVVAPNNHPTMPPTSRCAPAPSRLASPLATPPTREFQQMQPPLFDYHVNEPVKAESVDSFYSAQPQQAPTHSDLHSPTNSPHVVPTHFVTPPATDAAKVRPPQGFDVRPREYETSSRSVRSQTTLNLGGLGHTGQQDTVLQSTQHHTPEHESILAMQLENMELGNRNLAAANEKLAAENEKLMGEKEKLAELADDNTQLLKDKKKFRTKFRKADSRVAELEKENDRLKRQADNAVIRNGELDVEKEGFQSDICDFEATVKELEDENDSLRSGLASSEKKVEELEQELAVLRKLFRIVS